MSMGGGALMLAHKGQSRVWLLGGALPSSPVAMTFMAPAPAQISCIPCGLTMGDAMATPIDKANHTSMKRARNLALRRCCITSLLQVLRGQKYGLVVEGKSIWVIFHTYPGWRGRAGAGATAPPTPTPLVHQHLEMHPPQRGLDQPRVGLVGALYPGFGRLARAAKLHVAGHQALQAQCVGHLHKPDFV